MSRAGEKVEAATRNIAAVYPLTPIQEGVLFHTLDGDTDSPYIVQLACTMVGDIDPACLQHSWDTVIARHEALRAAFAWEKLDKPVQVIREQASSRLQLLDWTDLNSDQQTQSFEEYLSADREKGFNLANAPLIRLALIKLDADRHQFLVTYHHMIMDGWSLGRVFAEVQVSYQDLVQGSQKALPDAPGFGQHLAFLDHLDEPPRRSAFRCWSRTQSRLRVGDPQTIG